MKVNDLYIVKYGKSILIEESSTLNNVNYKMNINEIKKYNNLITITKLGYVFNESIYYEFIKKGRKFGINLVKHKLYK